METYIPIRFHESNKIIIIVRWSWRVIQQTFQLNNVTQLQLACQGLQPLDQQDKTHAFLATRKKQWDHSL